MRGLVHGLRQHLFTGLAVLLLAASFLPAPDASAADRRVIVTPNADYPGSDASTVKNVDLPACQAACLKDATCKAFTFNAKAGMVLPEVGLRRAGGLSRRHRRPSDYRRGPYADA